MTTLKVPGATIHYEVSGSGPVLLMIPGAPADGGGFAGLAGYLADRYTVVRYDLRGTSRSPLDGPPEDLPIELHVDDAHRLLTEVGGGEPAYLLGCSGGAMIGLDLVVRHPDQVRALVAHEPPSMSLLPDAAKWQAAIEDVYQTYRQAGAGAGMGKFIGVATSGGTPSGPPQMPDMSQLPPEALESMARLQANSEIFLAHMLRTSTTHVPDIEALRASEARIVIAVGETSKGQMPHEVGVVLADRLGSAALTVPGDHTGFSMHPREFADALDNALHG